MALVKAKPTAPYNNSDPYGHTGVYVDDIPDPVHDLVWPPTLCINVSQAYSSGALPSASGTLAHNFIYVYDAAVPANKIQYSDGTSWHPFSG